MASKNRYPELTESERFPLLTERGRKLLHGMRQHPNAPIWNWPNGEQLNSESLQRVIQFAAQLKNSASINHSTSPDWLNDYVEKCLSEVPYYRNHYRTQSTFEELPTTCRSDLAPCVWEFVPDTQPIDEIITFSSSGTTGQPTRTAHHPFSAACGIPILEFALQSLHGIAMPMGPEQVAITNVAAYRGAYTTAIVVAFLQESGCIRVNLDSSAWRCSDDCQKYINHWQAPIWLGDPLAYGSLERLELDRQPRAILSSIMHMTDAYAERLQTRYGCPVLDIYAMTESGIIAVRTDIGHWIIPHDLFVEVLDPQGNRCPSGVRGEVTLTGGRNPYLPLLRYRTGDFAALELISGKRVLTGLAGRHPTEYATSAGRVVHSMEITQLMRRFPVQQYEIRQVENSKYELHYRGDIDNEQLTIELSAIFGQITPAVQVQT